MFDDLDKCLSQSSNAVTRSTPIEYIDSQYLERDENTGQPKQPKLFDRKYIMISSVLSGDGQVARQPITVTQPQINFASYSDEAMAIVLQILNGVMSPATLGIDISKRDTGVSQREKEKITIFTRNGLINTEKPIQESLMIQLMIADQLLHSEEDYNCIERPEKEEDWGISVVYDEFSDASFEARLETVLTGWQGGLISDDRAIEYIYKDAPEALKKRELDFLKEQRENEQKLAGREGTSDEELAELGSLLGGDNPENDAKEKADIDDAMEDNDVMHISDYKDYEKNRDERLNG